MNQKIHETDWKPLESRLPGYGELTAKRFRFGCEFMLAVDHEGYRHLLIPLDDLSQSFTDQKSKGISVTGRLLCLEEKPESPYLDIKCSDKENLKLFNIVISDVLHLLEEGRSVSDAVSKTLNRWRKFWSSSSNQILTDNQIKGLFGELWFLMTWLLPQGETHVQRWTGPTGARNDFEWSNVSIEVKTTSSSRGHIHKIHGLDQLEPPENGSLYLFSLRVREDRSSQNTLPALIQQIMDKLKDPMLRDVFESRLAEAGYSPVHEDHYMNHRFRILDERLYFVDDSFPKLSTSSFVNGALRGIEKIDYEINLDACDANVVCTNSRHFLLHLIP